MTFAIGLNRSFNGFLLFSFVAFCFVIVGEALGVIFCAIFDHIGVSVNLMNILISFFC
jgi:hypothetical protein